MLALIDPAALPALRIAATFFVLLYVAGGVYLFRNRHRFFTAIQMSTMTLTVRKMRIEVVVIPYLAVTTLILILLLSFWIA